MSESKPSQLEVVLRDYIAKLKEKLFTKGSKMIFCPNHPNVVLKLSDHQTDSEAFKCPGCKEDKRPDSNGDILLRNLTRCRHHGNMIVSMYSNNHDKAELHCAACHLEIENESLTKTILEQKEEIDRLDKPDFKSALLKMCDRAGRKIDNEMLEELRRIKAEELGEKLSTGFADVLNSGRKAYEKSKEVEDIDHANANSPFKDNNSRNTAVRLFQYYIRRLWLRAGLPWKNCEHESECTEMIDEIINAAVMEVRKGTAKQACSPVGEDS